MKKVITMLLMCISLHGMAQENETYKINKNDLSISDTNNTLYIKTPQSTYIIEYYSVHKDEIDGVEFIIFDCGSVIVVWGRNYLSISDSTNGFGRVFWTETQW